MLKTFALIVAVLTPSLGMAQSEGLGNATKVFTPAAEMTEADWSDPAEMRRAWDAAIVRVPAGAGRFTLSTTAQLAAATPDGRMPTVIYLHGCSGIWQGTYRRVEFLAANGFLVIAPASMARLKYPLSCDPAAHRGGFYRPTLAMRQFDAGYAIARARTLPQVDPDNIFLVGLSQGAIATATFRAANPAQKPRARVVEGWTCHAGWPEYAGIAAPADEPVLTLVAARDPWFRNAWTRGDCGADLDPANGSRSVVYADDPLAGRHELLEAAAPRRAVLDFLAARMAP